MKRLDQLKCSCLYYSTADRWKGASVLHLLHLLQEKVLVQVSDKEVWSNLAISFFFFFFHRRLWRECFGTQRSYGYSSLKLISALCGKEEKVLKLFSTSRLIWNMTSDHNFKVDILLLLFKVPFFFLSLSLPPDGIFYELVMIRNGIGWSLLHALGEFVPLISALIFRMLLQNAAWLSYNMHICKIVAVICMIFHISFTWFFCYVLFLERAIFY